MPWLTPEEVLVKKSVADYHEALHKCGAVCPLPDESSQEAYLNGWWMSAGMGPAPVTALETFKQEAYAALILRQFGT